MWVIKPTTLFGVRTTILFIARKVWATGPSKSIEASIYAQDLPTETIFFAITYGSSMQTYFLVLDANTGLLLKDRIEFSGPNSHVYSMSRYSDDPSNDR